MRHFGAFPYVEFVGAICLWGNKAGFGTGIKGRILLT